MMMRTITRIFASLGALTLVVACGAPIEHESQTDVVIGSNDLTYYNARDGISGAIGIMSRIGCTATHIGGGYIVTAGHCVTHTSCSSLFDVTWGYTDTNRKGVGRSQCTQVVAREFNDERDYAILKVSNPPKFSLPLNMVQRPAKSDSITIYSHPSSRPLSWSGWCRVAGEFDGKRFSYNCDTEGGSSGAVVLNRDMEVVGVHNVGAASAKVNAGTYAKDIPVLKGIAENIAAEAN